jgi:hypothetical protein
VLKNVIVEMNSSKDFIFESWLPYDSRIQVIPAQVNTLLLVFIFLNYLPLSLSTDQNAPLLHSLSVSAQPFLWRSH